MKMKIAIAQISTRLGDVSANLEKHLDIIRQAKEQGADLLVFPELSLTGYYLQDLVPMVAHKPVANDPVFGPLLEASRVIDLVVGFVEEDARSRFYISAAYLSGGETRHVHRKLYLPTYGLYDEARFYAAGESVCAFDTRFGRVGLLICEDFWHMSSPYLLWQDGADFFIFISSSAGRGLTDKPQLESARWVDNLCSCYASLFTSFVVHTNRVGFEDGLNYSGGACVYDPNGDLKAQGPYHEEALVFAELDLAQIRRTRARLPELRDERGEWVHKQLGSILAGKENGHGCDE